MDEDLDRDPCQEDDEFFESLPNAEEMEQAIGKFLDGMPAVESKGYEQLHRHLARLLKRPNGISKRLTVFYTRSARFCCGATQTTPHVNPQRYVLVHTSTYQYILVYTALY